MDRAPGPNLASHHPEVSRRCRGGAASIHAKIAAMYARRRLAALSLMGLGLLCSIAGFVDTWGWAEIRGGTFASLVLAPSLLLAGWLLHDAARYAEGERRREAHRRRSSSNGSSEVR